MKNSQQDPASQETPAAGRPGMPRQPVEVSEFIAFIDRGAARVTPRDLHQLVAELPDVRARIPTLDEVGFPHTRGQLAFLADVVEAFALQHEQDLPYRAVVDGAFALLYFHRDIDLIPDSLGAIGYVDDAAVAATVLIKHASTFSEAARRLKYHWPSLGVEGPAA